jgi:hypothetical protein
MCYEAYLNKVLKYSINLIKQQRHAKCDSLEIELLIIQKISCKNILITQVIICHLKETWVRSFLIYIKDVSFLSQGLLRYFTIYGI